MQPTRYAPFIKRFVAFVVDFILSGAICALLMLPLALVFIPKLLVDSALVGLFSGRHFDPERLFEHSAAMMLFPLIWNIILFVLVASLVHLLYFALFESSHRQATPGKMLLGIFVTDEQGRRISFGRAVGRNLARVLSKMFCWLGYLLALFTERTQALHDLIASTLVLEPAVSAPCAGPPSAEPPSAARVRPQPEPPAAAAPSADTNPPAEPQAPAQDSPQSRETF
ncbi:RDD family protein [bacterium]|nr:RDD family protein [bacterium]